MLDNRRVAQSAAVVSAPGAVRALMIYNVNATGLSVTTAKGETVALGTPVAGSIIPLEITAVTAIATGSIVALR